MAGTKAIVSFASKEERMFSYYIEELKDEGWLKSAIYQPETFVLSEPESTHVFLSRKKSNSAHKVSLVRAHSYTADWKLVWDEMADGIFTYKAGGKYGADKSNLPPFHVSGYTSWIDVKGKVFGRNNSTGITFPINQKWVLAKYGIFVQKTVVSLDAPSIFAKTFTPKRVVNTEVYVTNGANYKVGDSKLKYKSLNIEEYVNFRI